jgi:cytochrome c oxidase subunit II
MKGSGVGKPGRTLSALLKRWCLTIAIVGCAPLAALADDWGMGDSNSKIPPSSIFDPVSTPAHEIRTLAFFTLSITGAIFLIVAGLLTYSIVRYRRRPGDDDREPPQVYGSNPIEFAWTTVPVLIVFVLFLITARTIYAIQAKAPPPGSIGVRVIAHQWWWEFQYPDGAKTGNELHIPVNRPIRLHLQSADIIHSFWVPELGGKRDVVPGQINELTFVATVPGMYYGQCAEFCGLSHANMRFRTFVDSPDDFAKWDKAQLAGPAPAPANDQLASDGAKVFADSPCTTCHMIQGVSKGYIGPDLTHFGSRTTLAAGVLKNTPENVARWIEDPQEVKPGANMPPLLLPGAKMSALVAYLESLK